MEDKLDSEIAEGYSFWPSCLYAYNDICYQCRKGYTFFSGPPACTTNLTGRLYYNGYLYNTCPGGTYLSDTICLDSTAHKQITLFKNEKIEDRIELTKKFNSTNISIYPLFE